MSQETTLTIIAIIAALRPLGVVVVESIGIPPQQQADARGCTNGVVFNASQGRCFGHYLAFIFSLWLQPFIHSFFVMLSLVHFIFV